MSSLQSYLLDLTQDIPLKYLKEIIDYAEFIKQKVKNEKMSDTEYLNSIPGMTDSIIKASKTDLKECSKKLEW
ncbi:MAG TPA: hypothetical protein ENL20_12750 [Candidatus Cloacimonetes bacterium]|nr:hypothetical protein [Candidatus Cloacimonadota bacterium]